MRAMAALIDILCKGVTDLKTIINWIAHPFELNELILKPEYL